MMTLAKDAVKAYFLFTFNENKLISSRDSLFDRLRVFSELKLEQKGKREIKRGGK